MFNFFFWGGVIPKNDRYKGGPCEKIGKLRGGHAIFKWCFPNPTSPPSLIKNERSLTPWIVRREVHCNYLLIVLITKFEIQKPSRISFERKVVYKSFTTGSNWRTNGELYFYGLACRPHQSVAKTELFENALQTEGI